MPGLSASGARWIAEPAGTRNVYSDWINGNEKSPMVAARASLGRNTTSHAPALRHSMTWGGPGCSSRIACTPIRSASARAMSGRTPLAACRVLAELSQEQPDTHLAGSHEIGNTRVGVVLR